MVRKLKYLETNNLFSVCFNSTWGQVKVAHTLIHSTGKMELHRSLRVQGQYGLYSEFQDSQSYMKKPHLENLNK